MSTHDSGAALGSVGIPRLICRYSLTTLAALLLNSVYTLSDTLFVSWGVGSDAMGGVAVVFPFVVIQSAISTALGGGAASLVSRRLGEGKPQEAGKVAANAMMAFYATAVLTTALGFALMEPMLRGMGVTDDLYVYARQYLTIILAGNIFSTGFSSIIRAEGKMTYAMLIWIIPISINIVLDALFILVFRWGVIGSAASTVIGQFASFCMCVLFFTRFSSLSFKGARLSLRIISGILAIGLPSLVQMAVLSAQLVLLNNVLGKLGASSAIKSFAYVNKILVFTVTPFTAVSQALAPVAGYNHGAGKPERVRSAVGFSLLLATALSIAALALVELLPVQLLALMTGDAALIGESIRPLRITALSLPFMPPAMLIGTGLQATGRKWSALLVYSLGMAFLLPLIFILPTSLGLDGAWAAYVLASALSCAAALAFGALMFRRKTL